MTRTPIVVLAGFIIGGAVGFACGGSSKGGGAGNGDGGPGGAGQGGAGPGNGGSGATGGFPVGATDGPGAKGFACQAGAAACSDGMDNDRDGKIDSLDSECISPCDNDEGSFATGIPGDNIDACKQDCFFDGNSGMGDDGCEWNLKCDPASPGAMAAKACPYDMSFKNCPGAQQDKCIQFCRKITPNGCDCFGCCAVPVNGMVASVMLAPTCTADKFGDPVACPRCTQVTSCLNPCEKCEVCVGKPMPDPTCARIDGGQPSYPPPGSDAGVPDGGYTPPPAPECPNEQLSCGPGGQVAANACPEGFYCLTGCCARFVP